MRNLIKVFVWIFIAGYSSCTIGGLTYMDQIDLKPSKPKNDECNPLFWYPKHMPDHCYHKDNLPLPPIPDPIPVPIPVQMPPVAVLHPFPPYVPLPYPMARRMVPLPLPMMPPQLPMMPAPLPMMPLMGPPPPLVGPGPPPPPGPPPAVPPGPPRPPNCFCPPCVVPMLFLPPPPPPNPCQCPPCPPCPPPPPPPIIPISQPIPYGVPLAAPGPLLPIPGLPYPYPPPYPILPRPAAGMVPGLPGIVSPDGGINVLPFSDAYADILEKHRHKEFRRKYRRLIQKYKMDGSRRNG